MDWFQIADDRCKLLPLTTFQCPIWLWERSWFPLLASEELINPGCSNFSRDLLSCLIDPCGDQVVICGILIQHLVKRLELQDERSYHGCLDWGWFVLNAAHFQKLTLKSIECTERQKKHLEQKKLNKLMGQRLIEVFVNHMIFDMQRL